ncbi:MAG TPA: DUF6199 family natural product biosynthesis protein [Bacillus sp. (in: firmicutes)]|uniref:DUF6199 family natural product biosynthesis protein n=1 Tax=Bacillus litorisediminis TaxID=2922713 RepID=UPI002B87EC90|nr:DUF6199 family natural product biosynthesis protein [Bacillus sp. (in: firmicutes)]
MAAGIVLIMNGLIMLIYPSIVWIISESWKSNNAEPSILYIWSTRFGGIISIIFGIVFIVKYFRSKKN